jgi:alkylhydroperoxidase family enzyme
MNAPQRDWHRSPDRTGDPEIRRGLRSRLIIKSAKVITRGRAFNFLRVLSVDGRLVIPYLLWNARLMPRGKLPRKQTEAVVIRTSWLCRSEYEWMQHQALGRGVGLSREQVDAASSDPQSELFDEETKLLLGGVEELLEDHRLSDATYEALRATLPPKLILEYVMLVGTYAALGGALSTFGVQLEEHWQRP